jgi:RIO-like serine/threonine protein kinase
VPHTDAQPALPFSGKTPRSRNNSYRAAVSASSTRVAKRLRYLAWLKSVKQATDQGAAEALGLPLSSICSIRNSLVDHGLVTAIGDAMGAYGKRITVWSATDFGGKSADSK